MARKHDHGFVAIRIEGGILPPEFLQKVAAYKAPRQADDDYGLPKGLKLADEIGRAWRIAQAEWQEYRDRRQRADVSQVLVGVSRWLTRLMSEVLGYRDLQPSAAAMLGERQYPINHRAAGGSVPMVLTTSDHELDKGNPAFGDDGRRRSPHGLVQEYLNAEADALWGIVANGNRIRLLRDNPTLTRPAFIEVDLERMFEEGLYPDFAAMWLVFHASRLQPRDGKLTNCVLETWRLVAQDAGERARDHLREGVTEAIRQLGTGFLQHPASDGLRKAISNGTLTQTGYHQQLLRLVYRFLFIAVTEDRGLLLHPEVPERQRFIYERGYSFNCLRERALLRRYFDHHADLWGGLQVVFRCLSGEVNAMGLPGLGGLYDGEQCPDLDGAAITNAYLLRAVRSLAYFPSGDSLARVNFRDMGTEELGSVYESLLELHPMINVDAGPWTFGFVGDGTGDKGRGSERKLSGSYYTPPGLVNELIKSALEPVMERTIKQNTTDPVTALLKLSIIDPACGSGHFLLAAARRMAAEIARLKAGADTPDEYQRQHALREVVRHCIYGVDRNPLSVELCKTALWIETVEPGKPLTFLDAHIQCGDSLVGVFDPAVIDQGIPDDAYKDLTGDDKAVCRDLKKKNKESNRDMKGVQGGLFDGRGGKEIARRAVLLDGLPEDTLDQILAKRSAWQQSRKDSVRLRNELRANLFVGAFFAHKTKDTMPLVPVTEDINRVVKGMASRPGIDETVAELAKRHRFFHWHLAFPEVFNRGWFDVVLGNPPWERIKLQEQEFFATRSPDIADAANATERGRLIKRLSRPDTTLAEQRLWIEFMKAKREAEAVSMFVRAGGRFPLTAVGDVNTYALFAEAFLRLQAPAGRAGVIVPTGIATDDSTKAFFGEISDKGRLVSLYDFENRDAIFPGVHRSFKFALLTLGSGIKQTRFVFFATQTEHLADSQRAFTLSGSDIGLINPNTKTCPVFRSSVDAELTKKIYRRVPVLIDEVKGDAGNPWGISFMRMFDMANDSGLFRTFGQMTEAGSKRDGANWIDASGNVWVPLYEAKMSHFFNHRYSSYEERGEDRGHRVLPDTPLAKYEDPTYKVSPFYWIKEREVLDRIPENWKHKWLLGWKDVTSPTNERTAIPSVIPLSGVGHTFPVAFYKTSTRRVACFLANWSSICLDYVARGKVGGLHLTYGYLRQFPFLSPDSYYEANLEFIVPRVLELTYTAHDLKNFAEDLGYSGLPFRWDSDRRAFLRAELDAYYAYLYGLTRDELRYILDPADVYGEDFPSETFRVLKKNETEEFGEYRTRRLVLEAWDRFERDGTFLRERAVA